MTSGMSLEDLLSTKESLVDHFYNDTVASHARARAGLTPVPEEYTNWIEEQRAWRETAVLFDQTHHMPELFIKGPDTIRLLSEVGVNSFKNFSSDRARQFVACNHEGQFIGETLIYAQNEESVELVSGGPLLNWVEYNAVSGKYDVEMTRDESTSRNRTGRRVRFRYGMDGPAAKEIFSEVIEGAMPEIKFFHTAQVSIAGCDVTALRHGMAGHMGVELSGSYEDGERVREAVLKVGERHGLRQGGNLAYFSATVESGWIGSPFPAIFTSPKLKGYREWLPFNTWEAGAQLGGSFLSSNIEDYYITPWDLGVEKLIKFDHDFIGREVLERMAAQPSRARRTLVWDKGDVIRIQASMLEDNIPYKHIRMPYGAYAYQQYDEVKTKDGKLVGFSVSCSYSANEAKVLSLVMIDRDYAETGTELILTWGEPNGGSRKRHVEEHRQTEVQVTVAPAPFAEAVRELKYNVAR